jgi:hypothetical protein
MPFGATQQEIQFSLFRAWLKGIINNSDFHNRTYHISSFINKLDFTRNTTKLEPHHLDLPNSSYTFSKLHSKSRKRIKTKQIWNHKPTPIQLLGQPGKPLRPGNARDTPARPARPAWPAVNLPPARALTARPHGSEREKGREEGRRR